MLTIIITVSAIWLTIKLLVFGIRAVWGVAEALCRVLLLPMLIMGMVYIGLVHFAVPIIIILGFVVIIVGAVGAILRNFFFENMGENKSLILRRRRHEIQRTC